MRGSLQHLHGCAVAMQPQEFRKNNVEGLDVAAVKPGSRADFRMKERGVRSECNYDR
jgi:hypothetical protein